MRETYLVSAFRVCYRGLRYGCTVALLRLRPCNWDGSPQLSWKGDLEALDDICRDICNHGAGESSTIVVLAILVSTLPLCSAAQGSELT